MADPSFSTLFSRDNLVNPQIPTPTDEQLEQTYGEVNQDTVNQEYTNNVITLLSNLQTAVDPTGVMTGNTMANPELIGQAFDYYKTQPGMGLLIGTKAATDFASSVGANALNQVNRIGSEEEIPVFDPGLEYADVFRNAGYDERDSILLSIAASGIEPGVGELGAVAQLIGNVAGIAGIVKASSKAMSGYDSLSDAIKAADEVANAEDLAMVQPEVFESVSQKLLPYSGFGAKAAQSEIAYEKLNEIMMIPQAERMEDGSVIFMDAVRSMGNPGNGKEDAVTLIREIGDTNLQITDVSENEYLDILGIAEDKAKNAVMIDSLAKLSVGGNVDGSKEIRAMFDFADATGTTIVTMPNAFSPRALIENLKRQGFSSSEIEQALEDLPSTEELMVIYNLQGFELPMPGSEYMVRYPKSIDQQERLKNKIPRLYIDKNSGVLMQRDVDGTRRPVYDTSYEVEMSSRANSLEDALKLVEDLTGMNSEQFANWVNRVGNERAMEAIKNMGQRDLIPILGPIFFN
jgi:hypothetical protein